MSNEFSESHNETAATIHQSILIIDDQDRFLPVVEAAIAGSSIAVSAATDLRLAKRGLLQSVPGVIICTASFLVDEEGGYGFCRELSRHETLKSVPVLLLVEELDEAVLKHATQSGARGAMVWPSTAEAIRNRLAVFFPVLSEPIATPTSLGASKAQVHSERPATRAPAPTQPFATASDDQKIQLAQQILARVLHNLKTSQLLSAADMDDVPRILFEITRAVCGVPSETTKASGGAAKVPQTRGSITGVEMDLEGAFGRKK